MSSTDALAHALEEFKALPMQGQVIVACLGGIALLIAIFLLSVILRRIARRINRMRFVRQYGLRRIPAGIEVRRDRTSVNDVGTYSLGFPAWRHHKNDGTRDRRYKANAIVPRRSVMRTGGWEISSYSPTAMNAFVIALRRDGHDLPLCRQEVTKRRQVASGSRDSFTGTSEFQLYVRFSSDSDGFERWCAQLLRRTGATVRVTPPSNDGGYDLDIRQGDVRTLAECKCYHPVDGTVGRPLLQKLVGANATEHAQGLMFMTTSKFSAPAVQYAKEQGIRLLDGPALVAMDVGDRDEGSQSDVQPEDDEFLLTTEEILSGYPSDYADDRSGLRLARTVMSVLLQLLAIVATFAMVIWMVRQSGVSLFDTSHSDNPSADGSPDVAHIIEDIAKGSEEQAGDGWEGDYVLPDSDTRPCSVDDLMGRSSHDLFVARNEIYARHGCIFETESLRRHFEACPWYVPKTPSSEFDDDLLSRTETDNVRLILSVEVPKEIGRATYVAGHVAREDAKDRPYDVVYDGYIDGNILQISGAWEIDGDNADANSRGITSWTFRLSDDVTIRASGGDAMDANLTYLTMDEAKEMLTNPTGLGLELSTNSDGEVEAIDWFS